MDFQSLEGPAATHVGTAGHAARLRFEQTRDNRVDHWLITAPTLAPPVTHYLITCDRWDRRGITYQMCAFGLGSRGDPQDGEAMVDVVRAEGWITGNDNESRSTTAFLAWFLAEGGPECQCEYVSAPEEIRSTIEMLFTVLRRTPSDTCPDCKSIPQQRQPGPSREG